VGADPVRVLVVDDHPIVRSGLRGLIESEEGLVLVDAVDGGEAAVAAVGAQQVDVVLMDLKLDGMDGIEATRGVVRAAPSTAVVMLTTSSDQADIVGAFDAGARGYVLKDAPPTELVAAIRAAHRGEAPMTWRTARALVDARTAPAPRPAPPADVEMPALTDREMDVLTALRDGLTNREIAARLGISEATVKAHLTSAFQRLGVRDRTQAALWMDRNLPASPA
jgi:DNA-binding NarL/FixJ family response regulator